MSLVLYTGGVQIVASRTTSSIAAETQHNPGRQDGLVVDFDLTQLSLKIEWIKTEITRAYLHPLFQHVRDLLSESTPSYGWIPLFPVTTTRMRESLINEYTDFHNEIRNCNPDCKPFVVHQWVIEDGQSAYQTESDHPSNRRFKQMAEQCERLPHPAIPRLDGC